MRPDLNDDDGLRAAAGIVFGCIISAVLIIVVAIVVRALA